MTIKDLNPSSDNVHHVVKKILSYSVFNEINRIDNRNGILELFRKRENLDIFNIILKLNSNFLSFLT